MRTLLAHGLVQRADLPIPAVVFAWCAAAVLVISFVALAALWPTPRLEADRWKPLPGGRALGSRPVEIVSGATGVALLALVVWAGFAGAQSSQDNIAPTLVYVLFWVGLVFASLLFGDVFGALNPWRAVGRAVGALAGDRRRAREYPIWLGRWPAALGLLFFTWTELVGRWGDLPDHIAAYAVVYSVLTWIGMAVYGTEVWASRAEGFGVYFNLFSRLSIFEKRAGVVGRRPPLGGLPRLEPLPGTVGLVAVMIGTVTFDGFSQGPLWRTGLAANLVDLFTGIGFGANLASYLADTTGLLAGPLLIAGFYLFGINGAKSVGGGFTSQQLRLAFVHSLVPIALVYAMAHYFSALAYQGQAILYLASDPLGHGANLFGTANSAIDYSVLTPKGTWYFQVAFVICGHLGGLILAHDRALAFYTDAKQAVRSQYWMLSVMVGFTSLALWLLSQANT